MIDKTRKPGAGQGRFPRERPDAARNAKPFRPGAGKPGARPRKPQDGAARPEREVDFAKDMARAAKSRFASDRPEPDRKPKFFRPTVGKPAAAKSAPVIRSPDPAAPEIGSVAAKPDDAQRIAKVMARAGLCSRRDAESWIAQGRVEVNGVTLLSPAFNVQPGDRISVDGAPLAARERTRLFAFHKPRGLVTTDRDPEGRSTIFDHLKTIMPINSASPLPRVVTIGRLDINTEGLLLLTNDGGLARVLELPSTGWLRRYRVRANGAIDQSQLDPLREGVTIDGVDYLGIEATLDRVQGANVWLTMGLREGKNREIKRVLEHLGLAVTRLIRLSFGPFQLGELAEGGVEEIPTRILRDQLGVKLATEAGVDFTSPLAGETPGPLRAAVPPRQKLSLGGGEARERPAPGARKHVSKLRAERGEADRSGPRTRVERGGTEDRKGRAVLVERVVAARTPSRETQEPDSRNARRFAAQRKPEGGARTFKPRDERPAPNGERPPRAGRGEGPKRFDRAMRGKLVDGPGETAGKPARFDRSKSQPGAPPREGGFRSQRRPGGPGKPPGESVGPKGPRGPRPGGTRGKG